ncbi:hypothetical protein VTO42DRAFT_4085 [Malbranchea cinnamomea]
MAPVPVEPGKTPKDIAEDDLQPRSSDSPLPRVQTFDAKTATADEVVAALQIAGGCIVQGLVPIECVRQIERDVRPLSSGSAAGEFFPPETRSVRYDQHEPRVCGKGRWKQALVVCLRRTPHQPGVQLGMRLNNTITFSIGPGARDQALHRDDAIHPGSHLWDYSEGPPREDQAVYAELEPGDAFLVLSGCFHAGSANTTKDEEWLQEQVGYDLSRPFLGWVNLSNPMLLRHTGDDKYKDLW